MMDDPVTNAAVKAKQGRIAIAATTDLIRKRMDPKLIAADLAKSAYLRSSYSNILRIPQLITNYE